MNPIILPFLALVVFSTANFAKSAEPTHDEIARKKIEKVRKSLLKNGKSNSKRVRNNSLREQKSTVDINYWRIGGILFIVLGGVGVAIAGVKKVQGSDFFKRKKSPSGRIQILDSQYIDKQNKVMLIQSLGEEILVGLGQGKWSVLAHKPLVKKPVPLTEGPKANTEMFSRELNQFLSRFKRDSLPKEKVQA